MHFAPVRTPTHTMDAVRPNRRPRRYLAHALLLLLLLHIGCQLPAVTHAAGGGGGSSGGGAVTLTNVTGDIIAQLTLPNGSHFTHLAYDRRAGLLYAGASNRIYQLTGELAVRTAAHTGPIADSPQCHAGGCPSATGGGDDFSTANLDEDEEALAAGRFWLPFGIGILLLQDSHASYKSYLFTIILFIILFSLILFILFVNTFFFFFFSIKWSYLFSAFQQI